MHKLRRYCDTERQSTTTFDDTSTHLLLRLPINAENNRLVIEPLCRCIANLRRHNQNHRFLFRRLAIHGAKNDDRKSVEQFLVAAKQFGIHTLAVYNANLPIQFLVEFCRDNSTHLKRLVFGTLRLSDEESTNSVSPQDAGQQDFSAVLNLGELRVWQISFENSTVETKFLNFIANVTYSILGLGNVNAFHDVHDDEEKKKIARMRIVSALIKPSVKILMLLEGCAIENIDIIEACTTVTQILMEKSYPPIDFSPAVIQRLLQAIATRNRKLAQFVANPQGYPGSDLLVLMHKFDRSPTGRYRLARCFPGIPSFFKIDIITDSSTARPKKRKRRGN